MNKRKAFLIILIISIFSICYAPNMLAKNSAVEKNTITKNIKKIPITIYYSRHCGACLKVENEFLPVILKKYGQYIKLTQKEIGKQKNLEELMNYNPDGTVPTILINGKIYVGVDQIEAHVEKIIKDFIAGKIKLHTKKPIQKPKKKL